MPVLTKNVNTFYDKDTYKNGTKKANLERFASHITPTAGLEPATT